MKNYKSSKNLILVLLKNGGIYKRKFGQHHGYYMIDFIPHNKSGGGFTSLRGIM